jgi:hypothetical protein
LKPGFQCPGFLFPRIENSLACERISHRVEDCTKLSNLLSLRTRGRRRFERRLFAFLSGIGASLDDDSFLIPFPILAAGDQAWAR